MTGLDASEKRVLLVGTGLVATLFVGFNVILSALSGLGPGRYFRAVATMVLGGEAFLGGAGAALVGLLVQGGQAFVLALGFVLAARALPGLVRKPWAGGFAYGTLAYVVMTWMVQPLSATPLAPSADPASIVLGIAMYAATVGVPLALLAGYIAPPAPDA